MRMHEKIRQIIETTPGLTQKGLAEQMGLNPAAINRMLYGRRHIMAEEVPVIEGYLGIKLSEDPTNIVYHQENSAPPRGFADQPATAFEVPTKSWGDMMVPVFGAKDGGKLNLSEKTIVDWAPRHPGQIGLSDAFAVYATASDMEPRYMPGELVYIHPGRIPEKDKDCIIIMKNGDAFIRRYGGQTDRTVRLATLNPKKEGTLARDDIRSLYLVIGRG